MIRYISYFSVIRLGVAHDNVVVVCLCSCHCGWWLLVCCWLFVYAFVVVVGESGLLVGSGA